MDRRANTNSHVSAQPRFHQQAGEIQAYGTVNHALPLLRTRITISATSFGVRKFGAHP
ncbi:MAG: hypothetical protein WCB11_16560 [Terriglobales bacterium]